MVSKLGYGFYNNEDVPSFPSRTEICAEFSICKPWLFATGSSKTPWLLRRRYKDSSITTRERRRRKGRMGSLSRTQTDGTSIAGQPASQLVTQEEEFIKLFSFTAQERPREHPQLANNRCRKNFSIFNSVHVVLPTHSNKKVITVNLRPSAISLKSGSLGSPLLPTH